MFVFFELHLLMKNKPIFYDDAFLYLSTSLLLGAQCTGIKNISIDFDVKHLSCQTNTSSINNLIDEVK